MGGGRGSWLGGSGTHVWLFCGIQSFVHSSEDFPSPSSVNETTLLRPQGNHEVVSVVFAFQLLPQRRQTSLALLAELHKHK